MTNFDKPFVQQIAESEEAERTLLAGAATESTLSALKTANHTDLATLAALLPASLGQKAKAASLAVALASDDDVIIKINTLLRQKGYGKDLRFQRPNDTTAYTAGDVVGGPLEFANIIGTSGGEFQLDSLNHTIEVTAVPSGMTTFTLHLYNVTPPSAYADNVAWKLPAGDLDAYLGMISIPAPSVRGTAPDSVLRSYMDGINKKITLTGTSLFAYLVTDAGYTPTAQAYKRIGLHGIGLS